MIRRAILLVVGLAFACILPESANAQLYVLSFLEPAASDSTQWIGECQTRPLTGTTANNYYEFGTSCYVITPQGLVYSDDKKGGIELDGPGAVIAKIFGPIQPGFQYEIHSSHFIYFPTDLSNPKNPPGNSGFYDTQAWSSMPSIPFVLPVSNDPLYSDLTYLADQGEIRPPATNGGASNRPLYPYEDVSQTMANFTAINIAPPTATLIQTQKQSFDSNLVNLQAIAGSAADNHNVTWYVCATSSFPAAGDPACVIAGQGLFDNGLTEETASSVSYQAPSTIATTPAALPSNNPNETYVCAEETGTPPNIIQGTSYPDFNGTCATVHLVKVYIELDPTSDQATPVMVQPGEGLQFTAYVNSPSGDPADVTWGSWQDSSGDGTPGQQYDTDDGSEYTYNFVAPSTSGLYTLTISGTVEYNQFSAPVQATAYIQVGANLKSQSITFSTVPAQVVNTPLTLSAKASSRLAVSYLAFTPDICTISGSTASMLRSGTCTIEAYQLGNSSYAMAISVSQTFPVNSLGQTITFGTIPTQLVTQSISLSASASSGLPVSFASVSPSVCAVSGTIASMLAAGTCSVQASQAGNNIYGAAPVVSQSFTVAGGAAQTISFAPISSPQSAGSQIALSAAASSGLPVTLTAVTPSTCTTLGAVPYVSLVASGTCTIQASQAGNATYEAAPPVSQTFSISQVPQSITFGTVPQQYAGTTVGMTATASSSLPVTYSSSTPSVCSASGLAGSVVLLAPGTCTVEADQAGSAIYLPAAPVDQSFTVIGNSQTASNGRFSPTNVGGSSAPVTLTFTFNTPTTLGSVLVLTQGVTGGDFTNAGTGTCAVGTDYNSGDTCTVNVTFSPVLAGTRYGAVEIEDGAGNMLDTGYIEGTGIGPQITFLPGVESTIQANSHPGGVAVDGSGNVYIADAANSRVLKETLSGGAYTESTVPTSSLLSPEGVAVDASGSIYIADLGNNRVLKESPHGSNYVESIVQTSTLSDPWGLAVDGSGNLYIADYGNHRVLEETPVDGTYVESVVADYASSGVFQPIGVGVDGSGNVYIADYFIPQYILKETLSGGSYTTSFIGTGLNNPYSVAVDGFGNLYVADTLNVNGGRIVEETPSSSGYSQTTVLASGLANPFGVAVDGHDNVYIADTFNNRVLKMDFADPPSLSFAAAGVGSTSSDSPQMVTIENIGNSTLTLPIPSSGSNPSIATNFTLDSSGTSACPLVTAGSPAPGTLSAGQSCLLPISFSPTTTGALTGALTITDNALNAAAPSYSTQNILLSGNSLQSQTIDFTAPPSSVTSHTSPITLVATASSGLPVTFSATGPASISGNTLTITGVGTVVVTASQSGNNQFAAAPSVSYTIIVTKN